MNRAWVGLAGSVTLVVVLGIVALGLVPQSLRLRLQLQPGGVPHHNQLPSLPPLCRYAAWRAASRENLARMLD